jgi:hypothetical protein
VSDINVRLILDTIQIQDTLARLCRLLDERAGENGEFYRGYRAALGHVLEALRIEAGSK